MDSSRKDKQRSESSGDAAEVLSVSALDPDRSPTAAETVLSYNAKKLRVQVTFTRRCCAESETPPEDLVARATAKMREAQEGGKVAFFKVYAQRLQEAWTRLRELGESGAVTPPEEVSLVLVAGAPALPGLSIRPLAKPGSLVSISIDAGVEVTSEWQVEWLKLHVGETLRQLGIEDEASPTQIHGALVRARAGERVRAVALKPVKRSPSKDGRAFHLAVNRARGEVGIVIFDLNAVADLKRVEERIARTEQVVLKLASKRGVYRILRQELLEGIEAALGGPERLGMNLPLTLLAAVGPAVKTEAKTSAPSLPETQERPPVAVEPKTARLSFVMSIDRMQVSIASLEPGTGSEASRLNEDWLGKELKRAGIISGVKSDLLAEIQQRIAAREDLRGLVVARGTPAKAGERPILRLVAGQEGKDAPRGGSDGARLRAYQRRALAKAGELIAETGYEVAPTFGKDVTGVDVAPPPGEALPEVAIGEGIAQREGGRFYAQFAGIVGVGPGTLSLQKALIHEGHANLASGDIIFDGPVEITGNIDSGANVKAGGDLIVRGEICGGRVECGGSITVGRGIVVGAGGLVRAKGDIKADFIENSTVICDGSLSVMRSVMQSKVMVGGDITVTGAGGLVGGGVFVCGGVLRTTHLGLPDGALTEVTAGVSFRAELSLRLREERLQTLTRRSDEERQAFREIMKRPAARLSKAEKTAKDRLKGRVARWSAIVEAARSHVEAARSRLTYSGAARIFVAGKLSANCQIRLGGKLIPFQEVMSVIVMPTHHNGSYIRPFSEGGGQGGT